MKYKTIIVEDELYSRTRLKNLLQEYGDQIEVIDEADEGDLALEKINEQKPDLVFMDIRIPGITGLEVAKQITSPTAIIFTTAHNDFALEAFETNSIDYIVKPISPERLKSALDKLEIIIGLKNKTLQSLKTMDPENGDEENKFIFYPDELAVEFHNRILTRGVGAKILRNLLKVYTETGRDLFTYRELQKDFEISFGRKRTNIWLRISRLKNCLSEVNSPVQIISSGRGKLELRVSEPIVFEEKQEPPDG